MKLVLKEKENELLLKEKEKEKELRENYFLKKLSILSQRYHQYNITKN